MSLSRFINPTKITKSLIVRKTSAKPWKESISTKDLSNKFKDIIESIIVINTNNIVKENPIFIVLLKNLILKR